MGTNYGKQFESVIKDCLKKVPDIDIQRLYDTTNGFVGVKQPSDYIVYKYPHIYYLECKSTHAGTLNKNNITQLDALIEKSKVSGVEAGVIIWYEEHDVTVYIPIETLQVHFYNRSKKSVAVKEILNEDLKQSGYYYILKGKKKRVFYDYDMTDFFNTLEAR